MKLLIFDQCVSVRREVIHLLRRQPDLELAGDGESCLEMVEQVFLHHPDIVLMGSNLFDVGGREMMNIILAECPKTSFILLAPNESVELLVEALRYGARGYLAQNISEADLIRSLYTVERGELALSRSMMALVVSELRKILQAILTRENTGSPTLTQRDRQILRLLATEGSNQDIARHLLISENLATINVHSVPREVHNQRATVRLAKRVNVNRSGHITD